MIYKYIYEGGVSLMGKGTIYCPRCGNPTNIEGECFDLGCRSIAFEVRTLIKSPPLPIDQLEEKFIAITQLLEKRIKVLENYLDHLACKPLKE